MLHKTNSSYGKPRAHPLNNAAAALGVSKSSLYRLADEGKIKFIKIGGRTLVPDSEVERLASEGTQ